MVHFSDLLMGFKRSKTTGGVVVEERHAAVTFFGTPLTLIGSSLKVGDKAPAFEVLTKDLFQVTLDDFKNKVCLISVVPSLDTPVCDAQTRRFNELAAGLPPNVEVITISVDLPFAQHRFCGSANIDRVKVLSDYRDLSFGRAYGVLVKETRLLARSVFVIDRSRRVQYAEIVKEITEHPDYAAALAAVNELSS
jgi:thiol peroxidase